MKRFYKNIIIFHLIFYPLFILFITYGIVNSKAVYAAIILISIGGLCSMFITSIKPLYLIYKKEKENKRNGTI